MTQTIGPHGDQTLSVLSSLGCCYRWPSRLLPPMLHLHSLLLHPLQHRLRRQIDSYRRKRHTKLYTRRVFLKKQILGAGSNNWRAVCVWLRACAYVYICMCVCTCFLCECICVRMWMCVYIYTCVCANCIFSRAVKVDSNWSSRHDSTVMTGPELGTKIHGYTVVKCNQGHTWRTGRKLTRS